MGHLDAAKPSNNCQTGREIYITMGEQEKLYLKLDYCVIRCYYGSKFTKMMRMKISLRHIDSKSEDDSMN